MWRLHFECDWKHFGFGVFVVGKRVARGIYFCFGPIVGGVYRKESA